jgi:starch phosphorylase
MPTKNINLYPKSIEAAYFSMEIMLESDIPTYAGGLGILAGDIMRSCADMQVPAAAVSLVYSGNTFNQKINADGSQTFDQTEWKKKDQLVKLQTEIILTIRKQRVFVHVWRYDIVGLSGFIVPVYLLDTDFSSNEEWARDITKNLYSGGEEVRINQEYLLGVGGVRVLRKLGYKNIKNFHLNEGHASFVGLELLKENNYDLNKVKSQTVFTTHTPVPEGHDQFNYDKVYEFIGPDLPLNIKELATTDSLHMTQLGFNTSKYSFGVSKKHAKVSKKMFPDKDIHSITNGVHAPTWVSWQMQDLYNKYLPGWQEDNKLFSGAKKIPSDALWKTHLECKQELVDFVNKRLTAVSNQEERESPTEYDLFDADTLTISMARRPVAYKRPLLLYSDLERFLRIGVGKVQIIQCGKSHPDDGVSKDFVRQIIQTSKRLRTVLRIVYLENYSPKIARMLVAGSDVWLNTPRRPMEASGTSGMKAAMNGTINFSILDGWWQEAFRTNPESGFSIGPNQENVEYETEEGDTSDANDLYKKLSSEVIPLYYDHHDDWIGKMKKSIKLGAYFNTDRVVEEYRRKAWK